jgi:hypothetical protein
VSVVPKLGAYLGGVFIGGAEKKAECGDPKVFEAFSPTNVQSAPGKKFLRTQYFLYLLWVVEKVVHSSQQSKRVITFLTSQIPFIEDPCKVSIETKAHISDGENSGKEKNEIIHLDFPE